MEYSLVGQKIYDQLYQAMTTKDIERLDKLLLPDMTLRHMTGYVQPKEEWLSQIQNEEMKYFSNSTRGIKVVPKDDEKQFQIIGRSIVEASIWGRKRTPWNLQLTIECKVDQTQCYIQNIVATTF